MREQDATVVMNSLQEVFVMVFNCVIADKAFFFLFTFIIILTKLYIKMFEKLVNHLVICISQVQTMISLLFTYHSVYFDYVV